MIYYIAIGSNSGDKMHYLTEALNQLTHLGEIIKKSSVYETAPYGKQNQNYFLNAMLRIDSNLNPHKLLRKLKQIELKLGRINTGRWGERVIDLDIIEYGGAQINKQTLQLPHQDYQNRNFVLCPLKEIEPCFKNRKGVEIDTLIDSLKLSTLKIYNRTW
jgi:2-amino-4-hydroxy-6-hydroxymethyldihydropteridine diphosphokinase